MRRPILRLLLAALMMPVFAFAQQGQPAPEGQPAAPAPEQAAAAPELRNSRDPLAGVRTGGLAPEADLAVFEELAREGFHVYVDLRTDKEGLDAARAAAEAAGMAYVSIPVGDDADLDLGSVRSLDAVLTDAEGGPAVVACATGNRSGALIALRAFWLEGMPAAEALVLGQQAGLGRSEPTVRTLLGLPPLPPVESAPEPPEEE